MYLRYSSIMTKSVDYFIELDKKYAIATKVKIVWVLIMTPFKKEGRNKNNINMS
jgi:hypothetical protein